MSAVIIEKKLRKLGKFEGAKIKTVQGVITEWDVDGVEKPDTETLNVWSAEVEADELAEKNEKKAKHAEDLALLGWDKQKLKAVKRLINSEED